MRKLLFIFAALTALVLGGCNDDPKITFFGDTHTYSVGEDMTLTVTLDGLTITDTGAGAVFSAPDGKVGQITLVKVIPGHGSVSVGGVQITSLPDGSGIAFEGQWAVSDTEMIQFKGTIVDGKMNIDIVTIPIQQSQPE